MVQAQKKRRGRKRGELSIPNWITPEMVTWLSKETNVNLEEKINLFNEFVQDAQEINRGQTNKRGPDRIIAYEKALSKTKKTLDILKSAFADQEIKKSFHKKFDVPMHKINSFHQRIKRRYSRSY